MILRMTIRRQIEEAVKTAMAYYPVVTITGPRQSGKTTLAKALFPDKPYRTLEDPDVRSFAEGDPRRFLSEFPDGAVLDEVQRVPDLLSYIQGIVDDKGKNGLFVLTGSSNLLLMKSVSQSLAGRSAVFTLLPFCLQEAAGLFEESDAMAWILRGGYPGFLVHRGKTPGFFANYAATYVERDVHQLLRIKNASRFVTFLKLVVGRIGSLLDVTSISNDCGISAKTVVEWLSVLQTSYICFLLPPWFENRGKRLVKSPKIYFYDTGLACALAGIKTADQLRRDPLRGGLFENFVILEKMKNSFNSGETPELYFYRDSNGVEVDLVEHRGGKLFPTEIKSAGTFSPDFCKNIAKFSDRYADKCGEKAVVYCGKDGFTFRGIEFRPFGSPGFFPR